MKLLVVALAGILSMRVQADHARQGFGTALPYGSTATASIRVAGRADVFAVAYHGSGSGLAVIAQSHGKYSRIWSHALSLPVVHFQSGVSQGVFEGTAGNPGSQTAGVFAFRLRGSKVTSAIAQHRSGIVIADRGVKIAASGFVIRHTDTQHVGSTAYRRVSRYQWESGLFRTTTTFRRPDTPASAWPVPNGVVKTRNGDTILMRLQVANTETERETGLMNVKQMDPDSGMVFVWPSLVHESFWMENTYIPLTVAFLGRDGTVQEMQDMQALTLDSHTPAMPYQYAIEANLGFFTNNGITVGDKIVLNLGPSTP